MYAAVDIIFIIFIFYWLHGAPGEMVKKCEVEMYKLLVLPK